MSVVRIMKWISGGLEAVLAIPFVGGAIIIGNAWTPLGVMLLVHIATLVLSIQAKVAKYGSILGIVTSFFGWVPFLGWVLHVITAVFLMLDAAKDDSGTAKA